MTRLTQDDQITHALMPEPDVGSVMHVEFVWEVALLATLAHPAQVSADNNPTRRC